MNSKLSDYKKIIEKSGYKYTRQKNIVLKTLIEADCHLTVKEIFDRVKDEKLGIASLYRILKGFKKLDIVKEVFINSTSFYELKIYSGKPMHIHFRDEKTGNILDIDDIDIVVEFLEIINKIEKRMSLEIRDSDIEFSGRMKNE